jgi:hypothetical protein
VGSNGNSTQALARRAYRRHVNNARCFAGLGDDRRSIYVPLALGGLSAADLPGVSSTLFQAHSRFHLTAAVATMVDTGNESDIAYECNQVWFVGGMRTLLELVSCDMRLHNFFSFIRIYIFVA